MLDANFIDETAKNFTASLPQATKTFKADLERCFRAAISAGASKFDLVSREEFDVQMKVLMRAREKLNQLEQQLKMLEQDIKVPA